MIARAPRPQPCCASLDWTMTLETAREVQCVAELTETAGIYQIRDELGRSVPVEVFYRRLVACRQWDTFCKAALRAVAQVQALGGEVAA